MNATKERLNRGAALVMLAEAYPDQAHQIAAARVVAYELFDLEIQDIDEHLEGLRRACAHLGSTPIHTIEDIA